jgi:hypothetical protein
MPGSLQRMVVRCVHRRFLCRVPGERYDNAEPLVAGRLKRNIPLNGLRLRVLKTKACKLLSYQYPRKASPERR